MAAEVLLSELCSSRVRGRERESVGVKRVGIKVQVRREREHERGGGEKLKLSVTDPFLTWKALCKASLINVTGTGPSPNCSRTWDAVYAFRICQGRGEQEHVTNCEVNLQ